MAADRGPRDVFLSEEDLDLKNLSGKDGTAKVSVKGGGLITVDKATQSVALKDGAGTTLQMPVTAQHSAGT